MVPVLYFGGAVVSLGVKRASANVVGGGVAVHAGRAAKDN